MSFRLLAIACALVIGGVHDAAAQRGERSRFDGVDRNGDGVITRDEWRGSDRSFAIHDWNNDGVLSGDEIRPGGRRSARDRGMDQRDRAVGRAFPTDELFSRVDVSGDGWIARSEWPGTAATFAELDVDRDGRLTREELAGRASRSPGASQGRAYDAGYARGLEEGRRAGREDRERNQGWDLDGQRELEQADSGYLPSMGARSDYQAGYREAFRRAYRDGWNSTR